MFEKCVVRSLVREKPVVGNGSEERQVLASVYLIALHLSSSILPFFETVVAAWCISQIMSDEVEDPVDPKPEIEENCKPKCVKQLLQYQACVKRVEEDDTGHKHCTGQYFDYWGCIDKCAAPKVFIKLK